VKCVVLSACESGKAASDSLNNGLTRQLALLGIPHVIGMRESILDRAGIGFARAFCDAIAREERIDLALQEARQAISQPLKEEPLYKDNADLVGELSLGQWCLPALISKDGALPLIDWDFTPGPEDKPRIQQRLKSVSLPKRFVGRRMELRRLERSLANGAINRVLITGPGGQGKTALGGKLARFLQERGYLVRDWSAINPEGWSGFVLDLELLLSKENVERYDRIKASTVDESGKARRLLELLSAQSQNRIALFFDNLESLQDPETLELSDPIVKAWMQAAGALSDQALVLLATSRWRLNGFSDSEQVKLEHASYGDFLQMAREEKLPRQLMYERDRLRRVYQTLHGNGRALHFFAAAIQGMKLEQEEVFLQKLAQTQAEIQTNMAIEAIVGHLDDEAQELLQRLPVYQDPVPIEGIIKLGLDLPKEPEALLNRLLDLSLVEESYNYQWHCREYLCSPLVSEWLDKQGRISLDEELLQIAAVYQEYLYTNERKTLNQAIVVHKALRAAEQKDKADRFALDNVVGTMGLYGFYRTLLDQWLPDICQSENAWVRAAALNQTGKQCLHIGDYDTALEYLKKSLAIRQEIGDKSGEGTTLNNISQIYDARGDYDTALEYLKKSLAIQQEIGDKSGEGTTLNNISQIYDARGDYDTALEYLKKSLAIRQEIVDVAGLCATLFNMGHIHLQNKEIQEAMQCWVQVYMLAKRVNLAAVLNALEDLSGHLGMQGGLQAWEDIAAQFQRDKSDDE
jgi:tetratricopeptide (TPR) repeat protein